MVSPSRPSFGKTLHQSLLLKVIAFYFMVCAHICEYVACNFNSALDLYGRGYSDAPHTTYDANLYTTQLALLLQYVGWSKANIVGVSMVRFLELR